LFVIGLYAATSVAAAAVIAGVDAGATELAEVGGVGLEVVFAGCFLPNNFCRQFIG